MAHNNIWADDDGHGHATGSRRMERLLHGVARGRVDSAPSEDPHTDGGRRWSQSSSTVSAGIRIRRSDSKHLGWDAARPSHERSVGGSTDMPHPPLRGHYAESSSVYSGAPHAVSVMQGAKPAQDKHQHPPRRRGRLPRRPRAPPPGSRPTLRKSPVARAPEDDGDERSGGRRRRVLPTNPAIDTIAETRSLRERLNDQGLPAQVAMGTWMRSYEGESVGYNQLAKYAAGKFQEALRQSEELGVPNMFRTSICCDLLDTVFSVFGRYHSLARLLEEVLLAAVFRNPTAVRDKIRAGPSSAKFFFEQGTHFTHVTELLDDRQDICDELEVLESHRRKMQSAIAKKGRVVNRTAKRFQRTIMHQMFKQWAAIARTLRDQRVKVLCMFTNRGKRASTARIMKRWKAFVVRVHQEQMKADEIREMLKELDMQASDAHEQRAQLKDRLVQAETALEGKRQGLQEVASRLAVYERRQAKRVEFQLQQAGAQWVAVCHQLMTARLTRLKSSLADLVKQDFANPLMLLTDAELSRVHDALLSDEYRPRPDHSANVLDDRDWRYAEPTASFMLREHTPRHARGDKSGSGAASTSSDYPPYREDLDRGREALGISVQSEVALHILLALPIDRLMMRWIHAILKQPQATAASAGDGATATQQAADRSARKFLKVENFGSDMANGDVYAHLISAITAPREGSPTFTADELLHRHFPSGLLDVEDTLRAAEVVRRLAKLKCPPIVSVADICLQRADANLAAVIYLFTHFPHMRFTAVRTHVEGAFDVGYDEVMRQDELVKQDPNFERSLSALCGKDIMLANPGAAQEVLSQVEQDWIAVFADYSDDPDLVKRSKIEGCWATLNVLEHALKRAKVVRDETRVMWEKIKQHTQKVAFTILRQRSSGRRVKLIDRKHERVVRAFTKFPLARLSTLRFIVDSRRPEKEAKEAEIVMVHYFEQMKNVFKHYAGCDATSEAVTLNLDEFTMLCTDTKLRLDTTAVRRIFAECCEPNSDGGVDPDLAEIGPSECMEALIRIAIEKYGRELSYVGAALQRVFEHHILPHARQTDANHWRQTLQRPALRALLTKYSHRLQAMYRSFASPGEPLTVGQFLDITTQCQLIDSKLTNAHVMAAVNAVLADGAMEALLSDTGGETAGSDAGDLDRTLSFTRTMEVLCAIAVMREPDPYTPIRVKLRTFLAKSLLPVLGNRSMASVLAS